MVLILGSLLGSDCARAQGTETQQLSLEQGENFVSLRVQPEDASLSTIFQGYLGQIHRVKDERGRVYMPGMGVEQFTTWDPDESYKVYTKSAFDMEVTGTPLSLTIAAVPLEKGGNMIPFLPADPQAVDEALASISGTLARVEDEGEDAYEPGGTLSSLDSLRAGQGYVLYVDQPDTLRYTIQTATLMEALSLEGVQPGQYIRARGRDESGDGGGGMFVVTDSACETDGGICFMFDESLTQVTGASSIDHTNLSWRSFEIDYGSDPKDVIDMRHLNGFHGNRSAEFTPWVDLVDGGLVDYGWSILSRLESNVPTFTSFSYTYGHTNSDRRLKRVGLGNSVKPEWWGAPQIDPNNPQKADSYLRWALIAARRIYKDPGNDYDRVWVDIERGFYFLNELPTPGGTGFRGVGSLNPDGYTRGRLAIKPGEALFYRRKDFDPWNDSDRERVYNQMLGLSKGVISNDFEPDGGLQFKDLWIDGNQRNQDVFQNLSDYEAPNGDSVTQWLQDSGDWSGFYTVGQNIVDGALLDFQNVRMEDLGASGLAIGRFDKLWDIQTSNLNIKDTRRNHLLYGPTGDGLNDITLEGQYWGGNPLYDPRGVDTRSTYTNLTIKNMYEGQFGFNTIIASRGGGLTVDEFIIDLASSSKSGGTAPSILRVDAEGNVFKNGTITGYKPANYGVSSQPQIIEQGGAGTNKEEINLLKNTTVEDHGVQMILTQKGGVTARDIRVEDFTYKMASGVADDGNSNLGTYNLPDPGGSFQGYDRAWRTFYKNFDWNADTQNGTFTVGAKNSGFNSNGAMDWYFSGGSVQNVPEFNRFLDPPGGVDAIDFQRGARLFLHDVSLKQIKLDYNEGWHQDLRPGHPVKMRNVTTRANGRKSDQVNQSYTATSTDESNGYALIPTSLLSRPFETSVTASAGYNVTGVEVANSDGSLRADDNSNQQDPYLKVSVDGTVTQGESFTWTARVTPTEDYQTTGLFVAREITDTEGKTGLTFNEGFSSSTYDLRGMASSQESREKIVYTASSGDSSIVTANVQSDDYTLELVEQGTGTATIIVTGEILGTGTATISFDVTIN
jgi:hypothetical protein